MKLLNATPNGLIFFIPQDKKLHIEFGNLFILTTYDELGQFVKYLNTVSYHIIKQQCYNFIRKEFVLHLNYKDIFLALSLNELNELKELLLIRHKPIPTPSDSD